MVTEKFFTSPTREWPQAMKRTCYFPYSFCPVGWDCRIDRLHLCQWVSWYDPKQSDDEAPVMLELWGMRSTPSLPSLPGLLWPGVVVPYRVLFKGQIEQNCVFMLNWIAWNRTVLRFKLCTGWNDEIVVLNKTTLQLYFKTFIEKINSGNLIM